MPEPSAEAAKRVLEPIERISEVLFGMIMVLTFTGSLSVAESGRAEVRTMLIGALGCNLAWGIIDAVLYLMGCLAQRGSGIRTLKAGFCRAAITRVSSAADSARAPAGRASRAAASTSGRMNDPYHAFPAGKGRPRGQGWM